MHRVSISEPPSPSGDPNRKTVSPEQVAKIHDSATAIIDKVKEMSLAYEDLPESYGEVNELRKIISSVKSKHKGDVLCHVLYDHLMELRWISVVTHIFKTLLELYPDVFEYGEDGDEDTEKCNTINPKTLNISKIGRKLGVSYFWLRLSKCVVTVTDIHNASMVAAGTQGLVKHLLADLIPKLRNNPPQASARGRILEQIVMILYNCARVSSNSYYFSEYDGIEKLMSLKSSCNCKLNMFCLFALAYLIDECNNHLIITGPEPVDLFVKYITRALGNENRRYAGVSLMELAAGITQVAVNDLNKKLIGEHGGIEAVVKILSSAQDDEERAAACQAIWMLAFDDDNRQRICDNPEALRLLKMNQSHFNVEVRKAAAGALWELEGKGKQVERAQSRAGSGIGSNEDSCASHIMISYQWDVQDLIKKVRDFLQQAGFKVWMDIDHIGGSTLQAMAAAVENAMAIIVCFSSKYKSSPNCRSEAEYAFQLHKPIIPLRVEKDYLADGWLGFVIGAKFYIDYTEASIHECNKRLLRELTQADIVQAGQENHVAENGHNGHKVPHLPDHLSRGDKIAEVSQWTPTKVHHWLKTHNLDRTMKRDIMMDLTGKRLVMLQQLHEESPQFFYTAVHSSFGFKNVLPLLDFVDALQKLLS